MIVSRRLSTVLLMRLIALSSQLHFAYGIPIGDANKCTDELDYRSVEKLFSAEEQAGTVVATEQSKLLSEAVGALQTDGKEFSHKTMYVKRQPRDASHSTTPSKNTFVNPYVYGLGRLPDTEVVNYKECLEYDLAHLDPSLTAKHTPKGSFVKNRKDRFNGPIIYIAKCKDMLDQIAKK